MDNRSNAFATDGGGASANSVLQIREDWRLARQAHKDLEVAGMPRTNLLLVGGAGAIRIVLEMLWLELREPILKWHPGQRLDLPSPGRAATLILQDVDGLTSDEQHRVLGWLDETAGKIRVVSTTPESLWPRVKAGAFSEVLYYRLNTVYVDVTM
jgi:hypothetical protein